MIPAEIFYFKELAGKILSPWDLGPSFCDYILGIYTQVTQYHRCGAVSREKMQSLVVRRWSFVVGRWPPASSASSALQSSWSSKLETGNSKLSQGRSAKENPHSKNRVEWGTRQDDGRGREWRLSSNSQQKRRNQLG